jgi:probable phosphomutase (TIGR03848 family)
MPVILLIRHGENDYVKKNRLAGRLPGVHLNQNGQKQAQALAENLVGAPVKAVYSSPLERALETAAPIGQVLGFEVQLRDGLIEVDFGDWQDQRIKALSRTKLWKIVQGAPSRMRFPNGETFAYAQHRIIQELEAIAGCHEPKDMVACVTHSDPIKLAVAYFLGMPLDTFQRLSVAPASISALYLGEMGSQLLRLNSEISITFPKS